MEIKSILLGVIVIIILVVLYFWIFSDNEQHNLVTLKDATIKEAIKKTAIPNPSEFSFSFWTFINNYNYNYGNKKYILYRGDGTAAAGQRFAVYLDEYKSDLVVEITETGAPGAEKARKCKVENIPLQRYSHILISYRARVLDIFIDGKLTKSCTLNGNFKSDDSGGLLICPSENQVDSAKQIKKEGFKGFLASLRFFTRAVQPREAYAIYKEGYSGGNWLSDMFNKYKLKIAFMEDQRELSSLIF